MVSPIDSVVDEIGNVAHVLAEDTRLREWFFGLEHLSPSARGTAFAEMASRMAAAGERPVMIATVLALASRDMYAAVRERIQELREGDRLTMPTSKSVFLTTVFFGLTALAIYLLRHSMAYEQTMPSSWWFWSGLFCFFGALSLPVLWAVTAISRRRQSRGHVNHLTKRCS